LDHADQAVDAQHAPRPRHAAVHGGHLGGLLPAGGAALLLDDRPAARQGALGADALVAGRRLLGEAVFVKAARRLPLPRRLGAVLAQIDPNFLLLGHASLPGGSLPQACAGCSSGTFSSPEMAGPLRTSPVGRKREPWHGQSHVRSVLFQWTWQPMCGHTGEQPCSSPLSSRYTATFFPPTRTIFPSPGRTSSGERASAPDSQSLTRCSGKSTFSAMKSRSPRALIREGLYSRSHGVSRPSTRSLSI